MREEIIDSNEAGQRLDKYLKKYLHAAQGSFIYKMLRKKNITLNKKKANGTEKLNMGDRIVFFLSDETLIKFHGTYETITHTQEAANYEKAYYLLKKRFQIIYEDENILLINKSAGVLSQKAKETDVSLNEAMIGYLFTTNVIDTKKLQTFRPSVCNRLDRNTSGLVICGKSLLGLQTMSTLLRERTMHKYYHCIVDGVMTTESHLTGYISKNEITNKVTIYQEKMPDSTPIITNYKPLKNNNKVTLLEVELVTGKTHQIRAHLASIGYPIIGDYKYGRKGINDIYKEKFLVEHQLLHAYRIEFPELKAACCNLSNQVFYADSPIVFQKIMEERR